MENNIEREFGWDETIENDGQDFITLPEGDYDFTVESVERARHNGSDKLPPCNKAVAYLKVHTDEGDATIRHNLFLHSKTEGLLCAFFTAIGHRKKGEKLTMNWTAVTGARGRARFSVRKWTNNEGKELEFNDVKKFYEPDEPKPTYTAGKF